MSKIRWVGFAINRSVDSEAAGPTVCDPTGALVASPTMGLPETVGGERNWDYRYTWMRDAAFTLYALIRVGFEEEAHRFMGWLRDRCRNSNGLLQPLYGIDGRTEIHEEELPHLSGYHNSRPVRLGNGAYYQLQLDPYGAVLDAAYLHNKYGAPWTTRRLAHPATYPRLAEQQLAASRRGDVGGPGRSQALRLL